MKFMWRIVILSFFIFWIIYSGLKIVPRYTSNQEVEILDYILNGFISSLFFSFAFSTGLILILKPRIKYIERLDSEKPLFKDCSNAIIKTYNKELCFNDILNTISTDWRVTYKDENENLIKFHNRIGFSNYGSGSYLKYDKYNGEITIISFPFSPFTKNGEKYIQEIKDKLSKSL